MRAAGRGTGSTSCSCAATIPHAACRSKAPPAVRAGGAPADHHSCAATASPRGPCALRLLPREMTSQSQRPCHALAAAGKCVHSTALSGGKGVLGTRINVLVSQQLAAPSPNQNKDQNRKSARCCRLETTVSAAGREAPEWSTRKSQADPLLTQRLSSSTRGRGWHGLLQRIPASCQHRAPSSWSKAP